MHSFVGFGFRWIKPLTLPSISYFNLYSNFAVFSPHFACKFRSFAFALAQRQIGCEFFSISISIYAKSACTVELAGPIVIFLGCSHIASFVPRCRLRRTLAAHPFPPALQLLQSACDFSRLFLHFWFGSREIILAQANSSRYLDSDRAQNHVLPIYKLGLPLLLRSTLLTAISGLLTTALESC